MTQPRIARADVEPQYLGQFASTRLDDEEVEAPDGTRFVAQVYRVIDADADPQLLQRLDEGALNVAIKPGTAERVTIDVPVVVHSPSARLLVLVIPESLRSQQITHRIDLLKALDEEPGELPYLLDFHTVVGSFGLGDLEALALRERSIEALERQRQRLDEIASEQDAERVRLEHWTRELEETERLMRHSEIEVGLVDDDPTAVTGATIQGGAAAQVADSNLDPVDDEVTAVRVASPYIDLADSLEVLTSADIEILDAPARSAAEPERAEPTEPEPLVEPEPPKPQPRRIELPGEAIDVSHLPVGSVFKADAAGRLALHFVVDDQRLEAFGHHEPEPFVQLHRLPTYPIIDILLVASDESGVPVEELTVTFDVEDVTDRTWLDRLSVACTFEVHLYDRDHERVQYRSFRLPLERNMRFLVARAVEWLEVHPEKHLEAALEIFTNEGYERLGARKHNFHRNSFSEVTTPSSARLAVNIVGYWSEAQNFNDLIENRSFPLDYFRAIQDRVIHAGVRFGIFLTPELRQRAVSLRLAPSQAELIELLIERFDRLTSLGEELDLDIVVEAENWDQLLGAAAELGCVVEHHVVERADRIRRQAHRASSSPGVNPLDLIKTSEYDRLKSLTEVSNEELQALLGKGGVAPAVSRELVGRGGATNIFYVIEGARALDDDSLLATARFLAAGADAFEPALLMGLGRIHRNSVHLCALALAMARRVEALPSLIELLHHEERGRGLPIADIIAEYGAEAVPSLFEAIEERGATDPLVEVLAMISIDAGTTIINALKDNPTPALLDAAQRLSEKRRHLGGRRATSLRARAKAIVDSPDSSAQAAAAGPPTGEPDGDTE